MFLNLNSHAVGITGLSFRETTDLAVRHGFAGIDCNVTGFTSVEEAKQAGDFLRGHGLRWGLFGMPCDVSNCSDEEFERGMTRLRDILPLVKAAGCTRTYNHIWPGSNTREAGQYADWLVHRLTPLVELLGRYGVQYGLEFLGPKHLRDAYRYPSLYTLGEMTRFMSRLPANVGIALDSFHWYTSGGTLDDVRALLKGDRIVGVHLNDARPGRTREEQMDQERELPGETGVIDLTGFVRTLRDIGYDGPVIAEPFKPQRDRLRLLPPDAAAKEVAAVMRRTLNASPGRAA